MPEWLAIALTIALVAFVLWVILTAFIGGIEGDIIEGAVAAFGWVLVLSLIGGVIVGVLWVGSLIWAAVPS